jgi:hypothetical protein
MKKIIYVLIGLIVLSSCSGGLYSHYPKVKSKTQNTTAKEKTRNNYHLKDEGLLAKNPVLNAGDTTISFVGPQTLQYANNTPKDKTAPTTLRGKNIIFERKTKPDYIQKDNGQTADIRPQYHKRARQSLIFSLVGWGTMLLALLTGIGLLVLMLGLAALVFEIIALVFGANAMAEMKKKPGTYFNEDDALAGVIISSIYLGIVALLLFLALIYVLILLLIYAAM